MKLDRTNRAGTADSVYGWSSPSMFERSARERRCAASKMDDPVRALRAILLCASMVCGGCMIVRAPSPQELLALDSPPAAVQAKIDRLFPHALAWYESVEAELMPRGRPLTVTEREVATKLGVREPGAVRVVVLDTFPMPGQPELRAEAERHGLGSRLEGGRTIGHVIMLKPGLAGDRTVLAHELVHVGQHDRMGREAFLRRYLFELEMLGYARAPLELEAYAKQAR